MWDLLMDVVYVLCGAIIEVGCAIVYNQGNSIRNKQKHENRMRS